MNILETDLDIFLDFFNRVTEADNSCCRIPGCIERGTKTYLIFDKIHAGMFNIENGITFCGHHYRWVKSSSDMIEIDSRGDGKQMVWSPINVNMLKVLRHLKEHPDFRWKNAYNRLQNNHKYLLSRSKHQHTMITELLTHLVKVQCDIGYRIGAGLQSTVQNLYHSKGYIREITKRCGYVIPNNELNILVKHGQELTNNKKERLTCFLKKGGAHSKDDNRKSNTSKFTASERGFAQGESKEDTKGNKYHIAESSAAMHPCVWIFIDEHPNIKDGNALHLSVEQAEQLANDLLDLCRNHYQLK